MFLLAVLWLLIGVVWGRSGADHHEIRTFCKWHVQHCRKWRGYRDFESCEKEFGTLPAEQQTCAWHKTYKAVEFLRRDNVDPETSRTERMFVEEHCSQGAKAARYNCESFTPIEEFCNFYTYECGKYYGDSRKTKFFDQNDCQAVVRRDMDWTHSRGLLCYLQMLTHKDTTHSKRSKARYCLAASGSGRRTRYGKCYKMGSNRRWVRNGKGLGNSHSDIIVVDTQRNGSGHRHNHRHHRHHRGSSRRHRRNRRHHRHHHRHSRGMTPRHHRHHHRHHHRRHGRYSPRYSLRHGLKHFRHGLGNGLRYLIQGLKHLKHGLKHYKHHHKHHHHHRNPRHRHHRHHKHGRRHRHGHRHGRHRHGRHRHGLRHRHKHRHRRSPRYSLRDRLRHALWRTPRYSTSYSPRYSRRYGDRYGRHGRRHRNGGRHRHRHRHGRHRHGRHRHGRHHRHRHGLRHSDRHGHRHRKNKNGQDIIVINTADKRVGGRNGGYTPYYGNARHYSQNYLGGGRHRHRRSPRHRRHGRRHRRHRRHRRDYWPRAHAEETLEPTPEPSPKPTPQPTYKPTLSTTKQPTLFFFAPTGAPTDPPTQEAPKKASANMLFPALSLIIAFIAACLLW